MGWIESPPYFCTASETARDVGATYAEVPVGSIPAHQFLPKTRGHDDFRQLSNTSPQALSPPLQYVMEVFVDDFITLAIPTSNLQLDHLASAVMHGIHDVFPPDHHNPDNDPISQKKLDKGDGAWANVKELLGFTFNGIEKTVWLSEDKRSALLDTLRVWKRLSTRRGGIPFNEFRSTLSKLQHAFITIPAGRGLLSPLYRILAIHPRFVFLHKNLPVLHAVHDCHTFLHESICTPTKCKSLITGWPDYVGITDASGHGVGGCIIGENKAVPPTVFRFEWPSDISCSIVSDQNPTGSITNSDLEMAGLLTLWLVMEDVCPTLPNAHVALFSDNSPTVHWVQRLAAKHSKIAMQLVRALALCLHISKASPLTPLHIAGVDNAMTDIPSRSFGSEKKWHCSTDSTFLTLYNASFPLPTQASWTVYRLSSAIITKVTSILRMKAFTADDWRRLPKIGRLIGPVGAHTSHLWDWTLSYRKPSTNNALERCQDLQLEFDPDTSAEERKSALKRSLALSRPLAR